MFKSKDLIAYFIFAIILFPVVFGFLGTDSAIYLQAGKTILIGEKIYVDFIDIKTPLFFTFYSLISLIINNNPEKLHLLLFFVFLFTSIILYNFIKNEFEYRTGFATGVIYSLATLIVGHTLYYHSELIFGWLLLLIIIYFNKININKIKKQISKIPILIMLGTLLGLYISIKYTFAIVLLPLLFIDFFYTKSNLKIIIKQNIILYSTILFTIVISHFWLLDQHIFEGYRNTLSLLSNYANQPSLNPKLFRDIVKVTGQFFGDHLSLLFTFGAFAGFLQIFKNDDNTNQNFIQIVSFLLLSALLLSVFIERKLIIYHFGRLIIPFSILSGVGVVVLLQKFKEYWQIKQHKIVYRTLILLFTLFLVFIGPFARYIGILRFPYNALKGKEKFYNFIDQQRPNFFNYTEKLKLIGFVNKNYDSTYKTLIVSIGSFDLIYELKTKVYKKLPQRNAFLPKQSNTPYYKDFIDLLKNSDLIIFQKNDGMFENLTGNTKSSLEIAMEDAQVKSLIDENFEVKYETRVYSVYQSKSK